MTPAMRTVLIIPTLNEAQSIGRVVSEISRSHIERIIVADGGSTDATAPIAAACGADVIRAGRGYGRACLAGVLAASDADIVVFMDGDGADDPCALDALLAPIKANSHDFVIGSRVRGASQRGSLGTHQRLAGLGLGLAVQLLYGTRYTDMCALRAIRRKDLMALGMTELTYGWNLEMQMRAARARLRILEIPVANRRRLAGESKVSGSIRGSTKAAARILATFATVAMTRHDHSPRTW